MFRVLFVDFKRNREWLTADKSMKTYEEACKIANAYDAEINRYHNAPSVFVVKMRFDGSYSIVG